jgi:hypothetical protein
MDKESELKLGFYQQVLLIFVKIKNHARQQGSLYQIQNH